MKLRKTLSAGEVEALWADLEQGLRGIGVSSQPEVAAKIVELVGNADAGLRDYADVIRADEGSRISICADDTCEALALDLSRNRSKRYCSTTCANRNAVAAYRARRAES